MELRSYLQKDAITFDIKVSPFAEEKKKKKNISFFFFLFFLLFTQVFMMKTSMGESIPGFYFQHPEAEFTLLFSHGNATDCGAMREFFIHMCQILPINVFAYDYTGFSLFLRLLYSSLILVLFCFGSMHPTLKQWQKRHQSVYLLSFNLLFTKKFFLWNMNWWANKLAMGRLLDHLAKERHMLTLMQLMTN